MITIEKLFLHFCQLDYFKAMCRMGNEYSNKKKIERVNQLLKKVNPHFFPSYYKVSITINRL